MTTISTKCGTLDLTKHMDPEYIEQALALGSWLLNTGDGYIVRKGKSTKNLTRLHRFVYELAHGPIPEGFHIDHIDQNKSNNFLSNLRVVTHQENSFNTKAKGYFWSKQKRKWQAKLTLNGIQKHLGFFNAEAEARAAYLSAKAIYHVIP